MLGKEFFADYNCLTSAEGLLSANMEKRLKKVRGENTDNENFLLRHNYKNNANC